MFTSVMMAGNDVLLDNTSLSFHIGEIANVSSVGFRVWPEKKKKKIGGGGGGGGSGPRGCEITYIRE